mmetsp:Transcript_7899/g.15708  ORF Transcript_7899/g.15708 Transcript_7899/m.15708 type:complete len:259 (+) Transcript_7899:271-1047(+)
MEQHSRPELCGACCKPTSLYVTCSLCAVATCRTCLSVPKHALWDAGHICASCMVDSLDYVDKRVPREPGEPRPNVHVPDMLEGECTLAKLADSLIKSQAAALAPSTWHMYQRCVRDIMCFSREFTIKDFPVLEESHANGLMLFFQHLKRNGVSWAYMAHFRAAICSLSSAALLPDPWERYPQLKTMCEGLKKESSKPVTHKEGLTVTSSGCHQRCCIERQEMRYWLTMPCTTPSHCALGSWVCCVRWSASLVHQGIWV